MLIPARRQVGNNARKQEEEKPYQGRFIAYARPMDGGGDWSYNDNYHNISGQESFAVE